MRFTLRLCQLRKLAADQVNLGDSVNHYAQFIPQPMSLDAFVQFGKGCKACPKTSFMFLRKELPVRLANIMSEFNSLPTPLQKIDSVKLVRGWYEETFVDLLEFEAVELSQVTDTHLQRFTEQLDIIRNRHSRVVETMAEGIKEFKDSTPYDAKLGPTIDTIIQYFLDRFYMNRISIRTLIHQHIMLFHPMNSRNRKDHPNVIGGVDMSTDVIAIAEDAYDNARFLCEQYYMQAPDCEFKSINTICDDPNQPISMTYLPSHLYHILFELFKNSLRAVVEYHQEENTIPSIEVLVCKGKDDVTIKLSDKGGGIPRDGTELLFNYMYSTAPRPPNPQAASTTPLAGYGYGLPLSRLYARYMRGSLWLSSVEGYGTDAFVYLKGDPREASENLPLYNKTCHNKYTQSVSVGDWSDQSMSTHDLHQAAAPGQAPRRLYSTSSRGKPKPGNTRTFSTQASRKTRGTNIDPSRIDGADVYTSKLFES